MPAFWGPQNWQTSPFLCIVDTSYRLKLIFSYLLANVPPRPKAGKRTPLKSGGLFSCGLISNLLDLYVSVHQKLELGVRCLSTRPGSFIVVPPIVEESAGSFRGRVIPQSCSIVDAFVSILVEQINKQISIWHMS